MYVIIQSGKDIIDLVIQVEPFPGELEGNGSHTNFRSKMVVLATPPSRLQWAYPLAYESLSQAINTFSVARNTHSNKQKEEEEYIGTQKGNSLKRKKYHQCLLARGKNTSENSLPLFLCVFNHHILLFFPLQTCISLSPRVLWKISTTLLFH